MPQLHFSVDQATAERLKKAAKDKGLNLSKYLSSLVTRSTEQSWPDGYLPSVVGSCVDEPLAEPEELPLDQVNFP